MKRVIGLGFVLLMAACNRGGAKSAQATPGTTVHAATMAIRTAFVGEGTLEVQSEKAGKTKLALEKLDVKAETTGDVAEMTIEHVFRNDSDQQLEGTFRFPMPEGSLLVGLAMEIDGKLMDGELVERDKARKTYEEVVDKMLDPALLEWENGSTFKLRVFPIEAKKTKRVVLKLVAPLHRAEDGLYFAYRPPNGGGMNMEHAFITVDGKKVDTGKRVATGEVLVKVADKAPDAMVERTKEGEYLVATVHPSFEGAAPDATKGQAVILLADRSRSMLEARELETRTAQMLLARLGERDRFALVTGDVQAHPFPGGLHAPKEDDEKAAIAFLDKTEPDGASDMGKLFAAAAEAGKQARSQGLEPTFVYVGDATATWGETRGAELARIASESLGGAALHVVVLGKSTDEATARAIASATHGRILRPKTEDDARRAADQVLAARVTRRIDDVKLVTPDGVDVPLAPPSTLYEGEDVSFSAFVPKDKESAATAVKLTGMIAGKPFEKDISIASALAARDVGKRWAKAKIELLERDGDAHKDDVVKTSLDHGVMSRYTSFLVLESEEAYAKAQIARKAKQNEQGETRVSGRDLEGGDRTASVSPDHLQPGDPEIRIPAPADAQSVVVVFPFGESKNAAFEQDEQGGSWVARFLVDAHTPDGTYDIMVRITHADGRVEIMKVPYVVDTKQPNVDVAFRAKGDGTWEIRAKQRITQEEMAAQGLVAGAPKTAQILTDAKRVEVAMPDGQLLSLVHVKLGEFVGTWRPTSAVTPHAKARVVAVDRALNERAFEVELP
ncbi:MAG TPA: VIT domain-containing protein [Labilithrix sp.]